MAQLRVAWMVVGIAALAGCGQPPQPPGDAVNIPVLPTEVAGLTLTGEPELYDTESIYGYIDGHAEVYLAYGMQRCVSQRYATPEGDGELVVDLFEMASPVDAFGVFSHDRAGEPVAVGNAGVFRHGWLSFWQGQWYGSIYATKADGSSREPVLAVGDAVADVLPSGGAAPDLVGRLPSDGLEPQSVCFLRSPQILNAHVFVGSDNPFGLGPETEVVTGRYDLDGTAAHVVLVRYPGDPGAVPVEAAADGPAMIVGRRDDLVAAVVVPEQTEAAEALLEQVLGGEG